MSLAELGVTISAVNEVSPVLEQISSDAASMSSSVSDSAGPIEAGFTDVGVAAESMSSSVQAASSSAAAAMEQIGPAAVNASEQVETASTENVAAMNDVGVAATAMGSQVTSAAGSFNTMSTDAEGTTVSLRTCAMGIRSFAMMGNEVTSLALDFGLVDKGTAHYLRTITTMIMLVSSATRAYSFLQTVTGSETAAVAAEGTAETATTSALSADTIAHNIYGAACQFATACEDALNISHATFLALTGVGIGVIMAAAAAIAIFASSMDRAKKSTQAYNTAASQAGAATSGITRAQQQSMNRRGVEGN